jgi:cytidine deaminase
MTEPSRTPTEQDLELSEHAAAAKAYAYVPYSNFRVGAALRLTDGTIVTGCNVENAAYSMTICGERTALVRLIAEGRDPAEVEAVAVSVDGPNGSPCGACRQVMLELVPEARITFPHGGTPITTTVRALVPDAFDADALQR